MRFKIELQIDRMSGRVLPLNYQYELAAAVYRCMSRCDAEYAAWLHDNGFTDDERGGKRMKLFCFSNIRTPRFVVEADRLHIEGDRATFYLSFLPERSTEAFVKGAFADQVLEVGDRVSSVVFRVVDLTILPPLSHTVAVNDEGWAEGVFRTLSPVCVSRKNPQTGRADYLAPEAEGMAEALRNNLCQKYRFFYGKDYEGPMDFDFEVCGAVRKKRIAIKRFTPQETGVVGYSYAFRLRCSPELLDLAGDCGLGEKGSLGFGFIGTM